MFTILLASKSSVGETTIAIMFTQPTQRLNTSDFSQHGEKRDVSLYDGKTM